MEPRWSTPPMTTPHTLSPRQDVRSISCGGYCLNLIGGHPPRMHERRTCISGSMVSEGQNDNQIMSSAAVAPSAAAHGFSRSKRSVPLTLSNPADFSRVPLACANGTSIEASTARENNLPDGGYPARVMGGLSEQGSTAAMEGLAQVHTEERGYAAPNHHPKSAERGFAHSISN
jgi:hypothetical protein